MSDNSICPVCRSPRSDNKSGSLTQWIVSCECDNDTLSEAAQTLKDTVCTRCGKKIKGKQCGSITQFIFGFAYCSCEVEERLHVSIPNMPPKEESFSAEQLEAEAELQISHLMFPLARYKPLSILWENFSGTLYLARDRMLNSLVTVRVSRQLDTQQLVEFQKWSQNLSRINHDAIVRVLTFGVTETMVPYLVCSQPEGTRLSTLLEEKRYLDLNDSLTILSALCAGLRAAHEQSVYYRIITTEDIIVTVRGGEFHGVLLAPSVLEKPERSPVEAGFASKWIEETGYKADSFAGSQPSEVYSMACVLFQMLSGDYPFDEQIVGLNELDVKPRVFDFPQNSQLEDSPELERLRVLFKNTITGNPSQRIRSVEDFESALAAVDSPSAQADTTEQSIKQATVTTPLLMVALLVALGASLVWGVMLLTEPGISEKVSEQQRAFVKSKAEEDSPSLAGAMKSFESKKWSRIGTIYTGAASNTDADFAVLNGVPDATDIALQSSDHVTGEGLAAIDKKQLQRINIQSAKLNDTGFKTISNFENLEWLALGVFDKVTPSGFEQLLKLKKLRSLSLTRVKLPENAFDVMTKMPALHGLEIISAEQFNHGDLSRLNEFEHLEHLGLCQQGINDTDCEVISKTTLNHLRFFDFLNNDITDKGVEWLSKARIYEIDLSGNKITDKSLKTLATMKTLNKLTIKNCPQVSQKARMIFRARATRCQLDDLEI